MASSYAALVSLQTIIHTIQDHPNPPISLDSHQVQSLLQNLTFLQDFLERHSHLEEYPTQDLESLIKEVAYAAEDEIESCIVERIEKSKFYIWLPDGSATLNNRPVYGFDLQNVIGKIDDVTKKAMKIMNKSGDDDDQLASSMPSPSLVSPSPPSPSLEIKKIPGDDERSTFAVSPSSGQNCSTMVGFDELFEEILHRLTGDSSRRQIIPIVGMGGIGKTTLAAKAYARRLVKDRFDSRVWVTISQNYVIREILLEIICQQCQMSKDAFKRKSDGQICEEIHKSFSGRRYLVVMDDMWNIEAMNMIMRFLPDDGNGSRIVITTRLSNLADVAAPSSSIHMDFLDEEKSWDLFCTTVFRGAVCPLEFEDLGKRIARNCKGLPLSIVVIGGFLLKSERTKHHWKYVARNLGSIVNLEDNKRCLKILQLSYRHLPIYLKPCFLYMGIYWEDQRIRVSYLTKLLVAEGFLKPVDGKLMEAVARECIEELVDRNLLLIDERGSTGSIRYCKIHDLLRDLCVKEAKEENFLYVMEDQNLHIQGDISAQRRIVGRVEFTSASKAYGKLKVASLARSLMFQYWTINRISFKYFKLLRILNSGFSAHSWRSIFELANSRFLSFYRLSGNCSLYWNLQTLIINCGCEGLQIWNMPQLRHVMVGKRWKGGVELRPPPPGNNIVLRNLQTLYSVRRFKCSKEVVERLPNIQKLGIDLLEKVYPDYCLNNLEHLHKLEHLQCAIMKDKYHPQGNITFPHSLKKLFLTSSTLRWENVTRFITQS